MEKFNEFIKKFLLENEKVIEFLYNIGLIILIFIIAKISIKVINKVIVKIFKNQEKLGIQTSEKKKQTLIALLNNITVYVIYFIAIISALQTLGVKMTTILAVAGSASVAIGLGAQNVIKDIIAGFFILFEDQFAVGDYVTIGTMSGIVEVVGLRITKMRDFTGELHIIPNGTITTVTNKSRGSMRALVDIQVAYNEDLDKVIRILNEVIEDSKKHHDYYEEGPKVYGIVNITETVVTVRITAKTVAMMQWDAEIDIRKRVKEAFDREGIKMPFQKMVFVDGKER